MNKTEIPWTDFTWTVSRGCSPVSAGCDNCYAAKMASRFAGPDGIYAGLAKGGKWTGRVDLCPANLYEPLKRKKPAKIFVNSMSDLFHAHIPHKYLCDVFSIMTMTRRHTYQLLTKRPEIARRWFQTLRLDDPSKIPNYYYVEDLGLATDWPLPNVWLGTTVENQEQADKRIPILFDTLAAVRFVSIEPMLEPINLGLLGTLPESITGDSYVMAYDRINWVIVGCESGPGARPCDLNWIRDIRDQCVAAGTPLFIKQARIDGKLVKMPEIDAHVWDQYPEGAQ